MGRLMLQLGEAILASYGTTAPATHSDCERIARIDAYKDLTRAQEHRFIITTSIPRPSATFRPWRKWLRALRNPSFA